MNFETPLIRGTLLRRYKRFLADVLLDDGTEIVAHVANPGSMLGLKDEGMTVWLEPNNNPKRKLNYSWKLVEENGLVGVDTSLPNKIVGEALRAGLFKGYDTIRPEVKYGKNSRIDFLLSGDGPNIYVEVKNVHFSRTKGLAEFPDSVTARGAKHLDELVGMVNEGHRAVMLYLVQRMDCTSFAISGDLDPTYGATFKRALAGGVQMLAYDTEITREHISLRKALEFHTKAP